MLSFLMLLAHSAAAGQDGLEQSIKIEFGRNLNARVFIANTALPVNRLDHTTASLENFRIFCNDGPMASLDGVYWDHAVTAPVKLVRKLAETGATVLSLSHPGDTAPPDPFIFGKFETENPSAALNDSILLLQSRLEGAPLTYVTFNSKNPDNIVYLIENDTIPSTAWNNLLEFFYSKLDLVWSESEQSERRAKTPTTESDIGFSFVLNEMAKKDIEMTKRLLVEPYLSFLDAFFDSGRFIDYDDQAGLRALKAWRDEAKAAAAASGRA